MIAKLAVLLCCLGQVQTFEIEITEPGTYQVQIEKVGVDPPPPVVGQFTQGLIPADGLHSDGSEWLVLEPWLIAGQRLSGTVTVRTWPATPAGVTWRLLVDGVPQASPTIDTTTLGTGSRVISCQVMEQNGIAVRGGSIVAVVNNGNHPFTNLEQQAVIYRPWHQGLRPSLAWGRVDVLQPKAYPLDPQLSQHPVAITDTDRQRLRTENIWWVEGISHQPTPLWESLPMLVKNSHGDYFVSQWNPQGGGSGVVAANAEPFVRAAPAFDGPRGVGNTSPYSSLCPDKYHVLASGQTGWMGVDKSGRIYTLDVTGRVETKLGPRSVAGEVQTDAALVDFTLDQRIAAGEKEYVGDSGGQPLKLPHDLWICDSFPFEGVVADTGNDQIREIHFGYPDPKNSEQTTARLMRKWPIDGVTSVWGSEALQQEHHISWVAVSPLGLWSQHVEADENLGPTGPVNHHPPELVASVPGAFWVRVRGTEAIVLTLNLGVYKYDIADSSLTELRAPDVVGHNFVFGSLDELGSIGPIGRFYYGGTMNKTSIKWIDIDTSEEGGISGGQAYNRAEYGNWIASSDPLGHYMWGFSPHATLPKFLSAGITSSSWFLWTACLGELPVLDTPIPYRGAELWRAGGIDRYLSPQAVYGRNAHGMIGYSCDDFRDFRTWDEARQTVLNTLEPFLGTNESNEDKEAVGNHLFLQRTRKHFQN